MGTHLLRTPQLKRACWGAILGWVTTWEVFSSSHEWGQSALERLVLVCGTSLQSPWVVTDGPLGRGVTIWLNNLPFQWFLYIILSLYHLNIQLSLPTCKDPIFFTFSTNFHAKPGFIMLLSIHNPHHLMKNYLHHPPQRVREKMTLHCNF